MYKESEARSKCETSFFRVMVNQARLGLDSAPNWAFFYFRPVVHNISLTVIEIENVHPADIFGIR